MEHVNVESSNVKSFGYDPVDETLVVRFRCGTCKGSGELIGELPDESGMVRDHAFPRPCEKCSGSGHTGNYNFKSVPAETYDKLRSAESPGKGFAQFIRGKFESTKG